MKIKLLFSSLLLIPLCFQSFSQGTDCLSSDPFCTGTTYDFPAGTNVPDMGTVGCLGTTPNPAWYYLQIANPGPIDIYMSSTPNVDIDFICWGPFSSVAAACASNLMSNSGVDCSYSTNWNETCTIPNGQTGEIYILLITNFSNTVCDISFSQTGGTGTTDCSIMCPGLANNGPLCVGQTLNITANPVSGATYAWTGPNGFTSALQNPSISNVTLANAGTYSLVVTVGGVPSQPCSTVVVINPPPTITVNSPSMCAGTSATLTANGGVTYSWSGGLGTGNPITVNPGSTTSYTVTGTDANGCSNTAVATVTVNANPTVTVNSPTICSGLSATLTANGASTYSWSGGLGTGNPKIVNPGSTTSYTVTGTDGNGCTGTAVATVTVSPSLNITVNSPTICNGFSATLTANGGTTYAWSNLLNTNPIAVSPATTTSYTVTGTTNGCTGVAVATVTVNPNPTVTVNSPAICAGFTATLTANNATTYSWSGGLGTGNPKSVTPGSTTSYTVTGTDGNGCIGTAVSTVIVNANPQPSVTTTNSTCGNNNGTANCSLSGLSYQWSNSLTLQNITSLPAGNYSVTVTDGNGCSGTASGVVLGFPGPTVSAVSTDENCGHANGTATATANGGTLPISYTWSNSQTTPGIIGLTGGNYTVTVTDANSCTATATVTVTNIAGPSAPLTNIVQETCTNANGSVTVNPVNGLPPYAYLWSNGVTNALNPGLSAGVYTVTVTDGNNCFAVNTVTITDSPGPNASIAVITPATCGLTDGAATTTITSGTPPFVYNWSNGQTGQDLSGVMGGSYTFTVTDANGCKDTLTASINTLNGPTAIATSTDANCGASNGTASVTANGGSGTYTYLWSNGGTTSTISNLNGGTYTVTVDDGSCQAIDVVTVSMLAGPTANFSLSPSTVLVGQDVCNFTNNSINGSTYLWDFGDGSTSTDFNTSHVYDNLGIYIVTLIVTDANGCVDTIQHDVTVNDEFIIYIPNTFSPNGDGKNDFFYPKGYYINWDTYEMLIFNRWGKMIYQTTDINKPWDGTVNNTGLTDYTVMDSYTYYIYLKDMSGLKHKYFGLINIIP